jgi:hypothetical protein
MRVRANCFATVFAVGHDPLVVVTLVTAVLLPTPFTVPHDVVAADAGPEASTETPATATATAALTLNTKSPQAGQNRPLDHLTAPAETQGPQNAARYTTVAAPRGRCCAPRLRGGPR